MRIALISDLHGNLPALEAALGDIGTRQVDRIVCLGDVAATGPQPHEAVERLCGLGCPVVMGNTDAWLLDPKVAEAANEHAERIQQIDRWCAGQLTPADREFIHTFAPTVEAPLAGGRTLLGYHGSPRSFNDVIKPETPDEMIAPWLAGILADGRALVLAGGHTHLQMLRRYRGVLLLNPGSVGRPRDPISPSEDVRNPAWAEYAIVESGPQGTLAFELRRVPYDLTTLQAAVERGGMPHAAWFLGAWTDSTDNFDAAP
jgi:predicted phosphodiesterase